MALLKLRATASHSPFRISSGENPFCCAWIMSLLANTEQRPAICAARGVREHDVADLLDREPQPAGLLIEEAARAGRAVAVGLVVDDAEAAVGLVALEEDVLGVLAAHLEQRQRLGDAAARRPSHSARNSFCRLTPNSALQERGAGPRAGHPPSGVPSISASSCSSSVRVSCTGLPAMRA